MRTEGTHRTGKDVLLASVAWLLCALFATSPAGRADEKDAPSLTVYVVNYPLQYFAQRILGSRGKAVFPCPAGEDPAFWTPSRDTIQAFQEADLILLNGAGYAGWVAKASLPAVNVVDTSAEFEDQYIPSASTTWIDFDLAAKQAGRIANAFARMRPDLADELQRNYVMLAKDLKGIDKSIRAIVSRDPSVPLIASQAVYAYFARRYGLNIQNVDWKPDQAPTAAQWTGLKAILAKHPAKWMLWTAEPTQASVNKLRSAGVGSLVFNPCGNVPKQDDFLSTMHRNVENLKAAFP